MGHSTLGLDEFKLAKLARELALNIREPSKVLRDYGLTNGEFHEIEQNEFFRRTFEAMVIEWNSVHSTADRVRLYSAAAIEEALPVLGDRMRNREEPLAACVDVGKFLARNAGLGDPDVEKKESERFTITINLGADEKIKFDKSIKPDPNDPAILDTPKKRARALIEQKDD